LYDRAEQRLLNRLHAHGSRLRIVRFIRALILPLKLFSWVISLLLQYTPGGTVAVFRRFSFEKSDEKQTALVQVP